jgi:hypothetical protein
MRDFKEIMRTMGIWNEENWKATENAYFFDNGSMLEFLSVQDSERRKGSKRDYFFCEECNELEYADFFQLFISAFLNTYFFSNIRIHCFL